MKSKFDPDGLPVWEKEDDVRDLWVHDDPVQMAFGWGCHLLGFSLPGFDMWLSSLPPCNAKTQLLGRRADALEAGRANNHDLEMRHLEFMLLRMHAIQRDDALLPLARIGKPVKKGRAKGGKNSAKHKQDENKSRDDALVKSAKGLIESSEATPRTVKTAMIDKGLNRGLRIDQLRNVLKKAGIK